MQVESETAPVAVSETEAGPGVLALVARRPLIVVGATVAAALAATAYIALFVAINPNALWADQRTEYVLLAISSAVACLTGVVAFVGAGSWARGAPRFQLERTVLGLVALTYGLLAASSATMVGDFHAMGSFSPSGADQTLQWTGDIAGIALFGLLVVDAILAADERTPDEVWWRGCLALAAVATLAATVVKLTAALTNVVYSHGDETWIGVLGVVAGVLVAASAVRSQWWWRAGVGFGLVVTAVAYVELGQQGVPSLARIAELSLGIALGYVALAAVGAGVLTRAITASRTPPGPAPYPD